jgi:DNA-binding NarL/FixJ family response regulator
MFTQRQTAVTALRLGKPNKIIAYELHVQHVEVHVHIMKRLKASNRTQVAYLYQSLRNSIDGQHTSVGPS